jgi:hypothetical protein
MSVTRLGRPIVSAGPMSSSTRADNMLGPSPPWATTSTSPSRLAPGLALNSVLDMIKKGTNGVLSRPSKLRQNDSSRRCKRRRSVLSGGGERSL